jgi:uncharacterized repeat protein (TIGR03803 family)
MHSNLFFSGSRHQRFSLLILLAACMALSIMLPAQAQTYTVLYSFKGSPDGQSPTGLVRDHAGNLYGVTYGGGVSFEGTAFKLSSSGKETVLYSFLAGYGAFPEWDPALDTKDTLYGTTTYGGAYNQGAVYKIDKKGNETVLYSFRGGTQYVGYVPNAVIRDEQGNLYGTTVLGGQAGGCFGYGCGIVFKVDPTGKETVLYRFRGGKDGGYPEGPLARDAAGNLYGTTFYGGDLGCWPPNGCGVVFKVNTTGKETVLHSFTGTGGDGAEPLSGLVFDKAGNLYGTTNEGGTGSSCSNSNGVAGCGTVFKVDQSGRIRVLYSFTGTGNDGSHPGYASLAVDAKGNVYGTTENGSCGSGCGVVFVVDPTGKETILHGFTGGTEGWYPQSGVALDATGNIYGTTASGGDLSCNEGNGCGVVYKVSR